MCLNYDLFHLDRLPRLLSVHFSSYHPFHPSGATGALMGPQRVLPVACGKNVILSLFPNGTTYVEMTNFKIISRVFNQQNNVEISIPRTPYGDRFPFIARLKISYQLVCSIIPSCSIVGIFFVLPRIPYSTLLHFYLSYHCSHNELLSFIQTFTLPSLSFVLSTPNLPFHRVLHFSVHLFYPGSKIFFLSIYANNNIIFLIFFYHDHLFVRNFLFLPTENRLINTKFFTVFTIHVFLHNLRAYSQYLYEIRINFATH